ncbi:MAG TPA: Npt1/Npt2 family nucleotide transporter [Bryobacteraceae bacterium]|nr:Npt1/Npt2 family nucleotide transporter [Bryobacteraceae bacterium]
MAKQRPDYQSIPELRSQVSFPSFVVEGEAPRGPLEKFLSLFADVRAGEGVGALLLTANVLLLLSAYYLLKTAREPLILTEGGASVKSYSSAGQAVLLMILVPLYGLVGARVNRLKLVVGLTLFFASHLVLFQFLGLAGVPIGVAFYIWAGIFNVFVISQFWAFANDIYTEAQGKRLFPMIGVGASLGAVVGAQAASWLFKTYALTPFALMNMAAAILAVSAALTWAANRVETRRPEQAMNKHANDTLEGENGFKLVFQSRYLRLIAALIVLLNVVNTTGEFLLSSVVEQEAARLHAGDKAAMRTFIGGFYGDYFTWVNVLGLALQTFAVSRIFNFIGVRGAMFILPSLALTSYSVMAVAPALAIVRGAKTLENATDYSLQNTVRQALFLPTSRAEKYKAKAAIDTFFMRFGDVLQAAMVRIGHEVSVGFAGFAWLNVGLTLVWLWVASLLSREHRKMGF